MAEYGIFLLKTLTLVIAFIAVLAAVLGLLSRQKGDGAGGQLRVRRLNRKLEQYRDQIRAELMDKSELKKLVKNEKKLRKAKKKSQDSSAKKIFVLTFKGDIAASGTRELREEVTAILAVATVRDEVVVRLESPGGAAHGYGLAASQLSRLKEQGISLTVCVDKVAASGGYMMACVADKIMCAPFSIIGSIGVVSPPLPNINRLLKKHDVDIEYHTAGEFKRTLTVLGENTEEGRAKFRQDLEALHQLFKEFVRKNRPQVDIEKVATGEYWMGTDAVELKLADRLGTSDQYLVDLSATSEIFEVSLSRKKSMQERLSGSAARLVHDSLYHLNSYWDTHR